MRYWLKQLHDDNSFGTVKATITRLIGASLFCARRLQVRYRRVLARTFGDPHMDDKRYKCPTCFE